MDEYNKYVTAINKIFGHISTMKVNWPDQDNLNYIESIEEYKTAVKESVENLKKNSTSPKPIQQPAKLEE